MKTYQEKKQNARSEAIEWQQMIGDTPQSWLYLYACQTRFTKLARKYGLTKEFKENGII